MEESGDTEIVKSNLLLNTPVIQKKKKKREKENRNANNLYVLIWNYWMISGGFCGFYVVFFYLYSFKSR